MSPKLHWIAAPPASLAHAAAMLASGHTLVDAELAQQLVPIVAATNFELTAASIDRRAFWDNIVLWSAGIASPLNVDIAKRVASALQFGESHANSREELLLRAGPLREAWEARGPGFWNSLRRGAREDIVSPNANVVIVQPVLGGGGVSFPMHRATSFEALLANPHRELPEVVRLGWLMAQLPYTVFTETQNFALALIPPVLAAAEDVELAQCNLPTIRLAIRAWHLANDESTCEALAAMVFAWWRDFENENHDLSDAMAKFASFY